jgi:hypothetical protein
VSNKTTRRTTKPAPQPEPKPADDDNRIEVLYVFVGVTPEGNEGLMTAYTPSGGQRQMITPNKDDLIKMGLLAQAIAQTNAMKVELREYHLASVFHEFERDPDLGEMPVDVQVVSRSEAEAFLQAAKAAEGDKSFGTS